MANTQKVTVTLPKADVEAIAALVAAGKAASVSGFVQHAVRISLEDVDVWETMLAQALEETGGPLTPEEIAWADSVFGMGAGKPSDG